MEEVTKKFLSEKINLGENIVLPFYVWPKMHQALLTGLPRLNHWAGHL